MGVKRLNQFFRSTCVRGIRNMDVASMRGKHVVVDALNYVYKFKLSNRLRETMTEFLAYFSSHGVRLTFVFDGKPVRLKAGEMEQRRNRKRRAQAALSKVTDAVQVRRLTRACVTVTPWDLTEVKDLLGRWAVPFITADGESDGVCAAMVVHEEAQEGP